MTQHFTRNTVSAEFWCGKCKKFTQHRIGDRRKGPCLECLDRLEREHAKAEQESQISSRQASLFGNAR